MPPQEQIKELCAPIAADVVTEVNVFCNIAIIDGPGYRVS